MSAFLLGAVAAAGLLAILDTGRVQGAADDLVANARQVLHTATTDHDDGVLLEVVALTRDVGGDLDATRQPHAGDLAEGGVRLLRRVGVHASADAAALWRALESRGLALGGLVLAALADQLLDGGHERILFDEQRQPSGRDIRRRAELPC